MFAPIDRNTIRKNPNYGQKFQYLVSKKIEFETVITKLEYGWQKDEYVDGRLSSTVRFYGDLESPPSWKNKKYTYEAMIPVIEEEPEYLYTYSIPDDWYRNREELVYEDISNVLEEMRLKPHP